MCSSCSGRADLYFTLPICVVICNDCSDCVKTIFAPPSNNIQFTKESCKLITQSLQGTSHRRNCTVLCIFNKPRSLHVKNQTHTPNFFSFLSRKLSLSPCVMSVSLLLCNTLFHPLHQFLCISYFTIFLFCKSQALAGHE